MTRARLSTPRFGRGLLVAALLSFGLLVGVAAAAEQESGSSRDTAVYEPSPVDVGFCQDMIVHHEQAVLMAQLARARSTEPRIVALAAGVEADQLIEIGTLRGFLTLWEAPVLPSGPPMTWMTASAGHHGTSGSPTGLATSAEIQALGQAKGAAFDRSFLKLMLRHHEGGLPMLHEAATRGRTPAVLALAHRLAYHQQEELQTIGALFRSGDPARSGAQR